MIPKPSSCVGCPLYEPPYGKKVGFSYPVGTGKNGVLIVAEALGEAEEKEGMGLVGKSGHTLFLQLQRVGIERDDFTIFNAVACRPPDNKLVKMPYEREVIEHCAPNLDKAIQVAQETAKAEGKTFVIVTLGMVPFKRVMGYDHKRDADLLKADNYAYPFWNDKYGAWVFHAPHPAYLLRGKTHLWPIIQFIFTRALEVAKDGLTLETHADYLLDPTPTIFDLWINQYVSSLVGDPDNPLSYDIETPYKKKKDEAELANEEDVDHTILRISFSYLKDGQTNTVSVKWSAEYMAGIELLFKTARFVLGWNSTNYDYPRVSRHVAINGIDLDGMVAWHILNTSLPKSLGFVTPFIVQTTGMWKHLSDSLPAFYNAKDADMALRNYVRIKRDLIENKLWHVFERHVLKVNEVLKYMTGIGVRLDLVERQNAEDKLQKLLDEIEVGMEAAVPVEARKLKVFKKTPANVEGMIQVEGEVKAKVCEKCGSVGVVSKHFASIGKKRLKLGQEENACVGLKPMKTSMKVMLWAQPQEFKVSKLGLTSYQKSLRHMAIISREKKVTFDADAITMLIKKYPKDPLYPKILAHRKVQKLLSTYVGVTGEGGRIIGGMPTDKYGFIHPTYTHNPATLRFACEDPNLQNLPRPNPSDLNDLCNIIRNLVVATEGNYLYARDYSGIEAVLTGYFALDPSYIRIAKRDVHTYYTVYALHELEGGARIKASDLPDLSWPDSRLFPYLEQLKKEFKHDRNSLYKHLVHAANFMQGAKGAQAKIFSETGVEYPVATVQKVMDVYYALFPSIKRWHTAILAEAEKDGYLRNPFQYIHRFSKVYDYKREFGEWTKKPGPDANRVIAFKPQSTAAAIIKEAMLRLYFNRFEEAGQYLRLQVHDELFFDVPENRLEGLDRVATEEMERPIPELKMPTSWNMGDSLVVLTESKQGKQWGRMK